MADPQPPASGASASGPDLAALEPDALAEIPAGDESVHHSDFFRRPWVQNGLPLATSIFVHLGLFIVGLVMLRAAQVALKSTFKEEVIIPDVQMAEDDQYGGIPNPGMGNDPNNKAAQDVDPTSTTNGWDEKKNADLVNQLPGGGDQGGGAIARGPGSGPGSGNLLGGGKDGGGGDEGAFGPKSAGGPPGPQSKIFGHGGNVKSICYVCDGSGSMFGGKDDILRIELKKSINKLIARQAFNAFLLQETDDKRGYVAFNPAQLQMASTANKSKMFQFIDNLQFHGTTNPIPALEEAFREHPQLIFLLTDGEFDEPDSPTVMAKIAELNKDKKVKVNTVLLLGKRTELDQYQELEKVMKKMADDNGGTFTKVVADDL